MFARAVSLLLALTLFWSTFAPLQPGVPAATQGIEQADAGSATLQTLPAHDGSPAHQPLDGAPGQAQAESVTDLLALVPSRADTQAPSLTMARPHPHAPAAWLAPHLDGPQRPPCAAALVA
ncbi:MAG TPA: hypothetical protein VLA16_25920 [Ideonella sp.]|nr:hypothetical protein [Ideonella sp.]